MPTAAIPFINSQASGMDELGGASPVAMNIIVEATGAVRRRPSVAASSSLYPSAIGGSVLGLHETHGGGVFAVHDTSGSSGRRIVKVTPTGILTLGTDYARVLIGNSRPVFAETEMLLVVSGGLDPQKIVLSSNVSSRLDGSPPKSTFVSAMASRLIMNDATFDTSTVRYSSVANGNTSYAGHEQWTQGVGTAGFFRAEARPDSVLALADNTNELFAWGSSSLQIFGSDPSFVFSPLATKEVGMSAPYSLVKVDQSFMWLDDKRRFVVSDGRSMNVISQMIQQTLNDMSTVDDCFGYRVHLGPLDAVIWTFPTDGRTFCYQKGEESGNWSQWSCFNINSSQWTPFRVNCHALSSGGENYIGTSDGLLGELSFASYSDISSGDPTPIVASVTTGFIHRGTDAYKHCKRVRFRLRRGETTSSTAPVAFVSFRDAPGAVWGTRIPVSLGSNADREPVVELHSLGTYRTRQWKFEFSDSTVELVLAAASEDFEVLQN